MMAGLTFLSLALSLLTRGHAALVINEFMADNGATIADPQGQYDDWIELYNTGPGTLDLGGMYLTDNLQNPTQWQFPAGTFLGQGGYLLIWTDDQVIQNPNGLHANFKLSAGGEVIGLYATNGVTLVDSIAFGPQTQNVSYGRFPNGDTTWYFMNQPSPTNANITAQSEAVYFSRLSGVMTNSFTLKLSTPSNTGSIRYTINGTIPTASSTLYNDTSGILINNSASRRIRARAFQSGLAPGPVRSEAYLAASPALAAFNSNLPIIIIDTFGGAIPGTLSTLITNVYATAIDTNKSTGRAAVTDLPDFAGRAGMKERGQSSSAFPKKPYKFETWNEDDSDRDVSLLGLPADSDWVLNNPYSDKTFMRNAVVFKWSNDMGHYASRTKFFELFVNTGSGQIGGPATSHYQGVYVMLESIKRGTERVDIEALRPTDTAAPAITGGYIIKHDKDRPEAEFSTWAGRWYYEEPSDIEITTPQKNYIKGYLQEFETVLQGGSFADPVNGYAKYIDVESFIDHDFCMEITRDVDPYRFSTFVTKDRSGKLVMAPEWDYNWSMGNNDYSVWNLEYHHAVGWQHTEADDLFPEYNWHHRLKADPEYLRKYADRWFHLRENVLSDATVDQTINSFYSLLNAEAAGRNFVRWNILNSDAGLDVGGGWTIPNFYFGGNPRIPCFSADHTYGMEVEWFKNWLTGNGTPSGSCAAAAYIPQYSDRLGWIDANMGTLTSASPPPAFFINGVPANTNRVMSVPATLTMTGSTGVIYYTLNGADPRQAFTGNAVGTQYTGGIVLNKTVDVRARIKNGTSWSSINQAVFADDRPLNSLRITEIMYHPPETGGEFIELKNIGGTAISLYRCQFTDGINFTFPDLILSPGQHVLVVENRAVFEAKYGTGHLIAGEFDLGTVLSNGGEEIVLRDAAGREIHDFDYKDWYPITDGRGASLCIIDPASPNLTLWDQKAGWLASSVIGGSPGVVNLTNVVANGAIVINEILTHTDMPGGDWIELHNTTSNSINIGGWFLSDDLGDLKKYQIASGTTIAGGGYLVFTQDANFGVTATDPGKRTGFGLSELGEAVYLTSGAGTNLSGGFSAGEQFGAAAREVTFGRHTKSPAAAAGVDFVALTSATKGAANAATLIPPVVIKEIMYHPSQHQDEVGEYIELFNRTSRTVPLYDPANPVNTWKFTQGIDYTFPPGVLIPAGAHVLVVATDPDIFRYVHNIPATRPIFGPYAGALGNDGDEIELSMPGVPEAGFVPYVRADKVNFSDGSHPVGSDLWPTTADGNIGHSLHRKVAGDYGNDVGNWLAAASTPATPNVNVIELRQTVSGNFLLWTVDGVLQSAPNVTGPWTNMTGATSPFEMILGAQPRQYFRVKESTPP
jgi:hypothetical protein